MLSYSQHSYWFHLHTNATEGPLSVEDYFKMSQQYGVEELIFLEHISRTPQYDVEEYSSSIKQFSQNYNIKARVGFEAKILEDGELDILDKHLEIADVIGIAEYDFTPNFTLFMTAWKEVIDFAKSLTPEKEVVWVHPGLFFRKNRLMITHKQEYQQLLRHALESGVQLEYNLKYNLLERPLHLQFPHVLGLDACQEEDIIRWENALAAAMISSA